jgi:ribosomal protein S18 acetylase RimI-like enzyme
VTVRCEEFHFRPAKAADVRAIQEFFYGLEDRDVHYRFLRSMKAFPRKEMAAMANIDYQNKMTILALKGEMGFERVVALGRYMKSEDRPELVEVDVAVAEDYRRRGVGRALMEYVFEIAEDKGYKGVVAYVAHDNTNTLKLIKAMGFQARAVLNMGIFEVVFYFADRREEGNIEIIYPGQEE